MTSLSVTACGQVASNAIDSGNAVDAPGGGVDAADTDAITPDGPGGPDASIDAATPGPTPQFAAPVDYATPAVPTVVTTVDLNGDGIREVVGTTFNGTTARLFVLIGQAGGTFATPAREFAVLPEPGGLAIADFNEDGRLDAAVGCSGSSLGTPNFLAGNGDGTFATATTSQAIGGALGQLAHAETNADGNLDLAGVDWGGNTLRISRGNGNGTFATATVMAAGQSPHGLTLGNIDSDQLPDLLSANTNSGNVGFYKNNGNGTFATQILSPAGTNAYKLALGDFNRDGKLDVAVSRTASLSSGIGVNVLIGVGDGTFFAPVPYTGPGTEDIVVSDFNRDTILDIAAVSQNNSQLLVYAGNGDGTFDAAVTLTTGANPYGVTAADVNADGKVDIIVANSTGNSVSVFRNSTP